MSPIQSVVTHAALECTVQLTHAVGAGMAHGDDPGQQPAKSCLRHLHTYLMFCDGSDDM